MSDVQYEVVPQHELTETQRYVLNNGQEAPSWEGGAVAVGAGAAKEAVQKGYPILSNKVKSVLENRFGSQPGASVEIGPITTESGASVPKTGGTTVPKTGGINWNEALTGNSAAGSQMDKASLLKNQEMMKTIGPGGELAGGEIRGGNVIIGPDMKSSPKLANVGVPELAHLPVGSPEYWEALDKYIAGQPIEPPPSKTLTPAEKAMQVARGVGSQLSPIYNRMAPILNPALTALGYYDMGHEGMEAYKHYKHGDYFPAALNVLGGLGTATAMYAPHPIAKGLGIGTSLGADYLARKIDKKRGRNYAEGGLVYLGQ